MLSWQVGAVKVTRIVEIELPVTYNPDRPFLAEATPEALRAMPWLYPHFVNENDQLRLSIHALLVEAPGLRLVVDTCIGNDRPRSLLGGQALATDFLGSLAEAGWSRDSVDAVVCTHLHVDHVGWNTRLVDGRWVPTFPNAKYLFARAEWEYWREHYKTEQFRDDPHRQSGDELADDLELHPGQVVPAAGRGDRGQGAGPAAALQFEGHPAAQGIADDVGGFPAQCVELAFDVVGEDVGVQQERAGSRTAVVADHGGSVDLVAAGADTEGLGEDGLHGLWAHVSVVRFRGGWCGVEKRENRVSRLLLSCVSSLLLPHCLVKVDHGILNGGLRADDPE